MKKLLLLFALVLTACSTAMAQDGPAKNEIWYTSSNGQIVVPNSENAFGVSITGNTYTGGKGCITFSGDITNIGEGAFKGCKTLTTFTVPDGLATVGTSAFQDCCRLKQITFPSSVTRIETSAFSGCDDLVLVKLLGSSVPWTQQTFVNSGANVGGKTFLVPEEAVEAYKNSGWSPTYSSTLAGDALESLKTTAQAAMENAKNAESALTDGDKASIATYKSNVGSATNIEDLLNERAKAFYVISLRKAKTTALNAISEAEANVTLTDAEKASVNLCKENIENGTDIAAVRQETAKANMILLKTRVIIYTSSNGQVVTPSNSAAFGELTIVSNEYDKEMGRGCITFSGDVTSIGFRAFFWCENLTSVTIPDLVTSIGEHAFLNCANLTSVTIPDLVTSIGELAFSNCENLTSVTIPDLVTSIGDYAFSYCENLTSVTIPDLVTSIGEHAFDGCYFSSLVTNENLNAKENNYWGATMCNSDGLAIKDNIVVDCAPWATSVTIPDGITGIKDNAFSSCSGLKGNLVIPSTVTSIGESAFDGCNNLTSLTVKGGSIGLWAFYGCSGLTSVSLQEGVTGIVDEAFYGCSGIEGTLVIPSTVTSIGSRAFADCNNLTSLTVKSGSIGNSAFYGCSGLTSVSLQEGVTGIGDEAFYGCSGIEGALIIPSTVTSIGESAFDGCNNLTSLTIKGGSIGNYAFYGCYGLTSVSLQEGVTSIGDNAFSGCSGIEGALVIPSTVKSIGASAFYGCSGIEGALVIPSTVTSIGDGAFANCDKLTSILSLALLPPSLGKYTFEFVPKDIPVYVLDDVAYKNAEGWKEFTNIQLINYFKLGDTTYSLDDDGKIVGGELTFTDKDEYLSYPDFTVEKLTYSRTFKDNNWQALYVPFAMSYGEWKDNFEVAAINNFHEYTDDMGQTVKTELEVRLVKSGKLKPNHPYLIKAKIADENNPKTIELSTKEICKSDEKSYSCSSMESKYTFTGTYHEKNELKTDDYIFMSGGKLCKANNDEVVLSPQRWYLKIESLGSQVDGGNTSYAKAKEFNIKLLDDEATGIDEITVTRTPLRNSSEAIYNLNGMRVNGNYKGVVIKNGKKYYQR